MSLLSLMSKAQTHKGHTVPHFQDSGSIVPAKTESVNVQSSSVPVWGSMFTIDVREMNVLVKRGTLDFLLPAITGYTNGKYVPAQYFVDHIDYFQNGEIKYTAYPVSQFVLQQLYSGSDEDRLLGNCASGLYSSTAQRINLASTANHYYLPLYDFFKQANGSYPLVDPSHQLQLRVYLRNLSEVSTGTGTQTATGITSCNLLLDVVRLRENEANAIRNDIAKKGLSFKFSDLRQQVNTVNSGVSTATINLQSIVGPVSQLCFVVRNSNALSGENAFAFNAIASFEITNASGSNIVGGQVINNAQSLLINGNAYSRSSYLAENALGTTDNKANVYIYSFANDPELNIAQAVSSGSYNFTGAEVLKINFASSLASNVQVDINAYVDSVITLTRGNSLKTIF